MCPHTKLLNSDSQTHIALSTELFALGVTVRKTGKFRGNFLSLTLFPPRYLRRSWKYSDSRPYSVLKLRSVFTGKLSNT